MADERKSFGELLSEAPLARDEGTISLVGALERSHDAGKFVLVLAAGRNVTLEVDAVKGYQVLGGAVGQLLVRVEVDRERVPREITGAGNPPPVPWSAAGLGVPAAGFKVIADNPPKNPYVDLPVKNIFEPIVDPSLGGDPYQWGGVYQAPFAGAVAPFALAIPHHVPVGIGGMRGPSIFDRTIAVNEYTNPGLDQTYTNPRWDDPATIYWKGPNPLD